ncbi:hypothetical protein BCR39DRAFT_551169 [Naematelia encephala]|uniref:BZIP domain-containing protein n=1 Tax=Naematelia encephala TaxID=71784 RepID=A0A1Y2AJY5_9TREE|nr:hypothetical protein BCR39DRAFT_551169 [Naematelia encephala]
MDYDLLSSTFQSHGTTDAEHEAAAQEVVAHLENAEREAQAAGLASSSSSSHVIQDVVDNGQVQVENGGDSIEQQQQQQQIEQQQQHQQQQQQIEQQSQQHDTSSFQEHVELEDDGEYLPDNAGLRGKNGTLGLTEDEKKRRQKEQNRKAAEKSRGKRREEATTMEVTVQNLQDQNARLRAKLAVLAASRPNPSSDPTTIVEGSTSTPSAPAGTGIDLVYVGKLRQELLSAKRTLLDKEAQIARLRGDSTPSTNVDGIRMNMLQRNAELTQLSAEARSLEVMTAQLSAEKDELTRQARVVSDELDARKVLKAVGEGQVEEAGLGEGDADGIEEHAGQEGVDGTLLDVRWIDEAVRNYDHSAGIPSLQALEHSDLEAIGGSGDH